MAVRQVRAEIRARREGEERWYRLRRFATANAMTYEPYHWDPDLPASLFRRGGSRTIRDSLSTASLQVANYSYEKMAARTRMQYAACFLDVDAQGVLPPLNLLTKRGNVWDHQAEQPKLQREVQLGHEFDDHFRVYCEPQHDSAVRRSLSPEVCRALLVLTENCDVEVVQDRMYVIARRELPMTDAEFWGWVEDVGELVKSAFINSEPLGDSVLTGWEERRRERAALFATPPSGRPFLIGCLMPAVFGIVAAAVTSQLG